MYDTVNCRYKNIIYSMTNAADNNEVIALKLDSYHNTIQVTSYQTGGKGTGSPNEDPLNSQGAVILSPDKHFLFVVNAGSNSITSFRITSSGALVLADVKPSGGFQPISLTAHYGLLYAANAGNGSSIASNIVGFQVDANGILTEIAGSSKRLSSAQAKPACIVTNYNGEIIAVTERNTNLLSIFIIQTDGSLNDPIISNSSGSGPFGAVFLTNEILLVAEAGTNAISSYRVNPDGTLSVISSSVLNYQEATCWIALSENRRYAYTSNAGSNTISAFEIDCGGNMSVSNISYSTNNGMGSPIDSSVCVDNLYVLNGNEGSISIFHTDRGGKLTRTTELRGTLLPNIGSQGLATLRFADNY